MNEADIVRRWVLITFGAACVLPLAAVDPAAALPLFDLEILLAIGSAGLALSRGDARNAWHRFLDHPDVLSFRVGVILTRESPRSLLHA